jgi:ferredoxin-NADP reductase
MVGAVAKKELVDDMIQAAPKTLKVSVRSITPYGENIRCFEVVDLNNRPLPPWHAGSHIDVHLSDEIGGIRQYSLCGDPADRFRYRFAVQQEQNGRGGSKKIFETVHAGSVLSIGAPRNNFAIRYEAQRHLLLAGGIGITPMMSMVHDLEREKCDFTLHYCTRSPDRTAFLDRLAPLQSEGKAFIHWDYGNPSDGLDLKTLLKDCAEGTHLYYCGPPGFMGAVASASAHWPKGTVHREFFTPSANDPAIAVANFGAAKGDEVAEGMGKPFQVKIASTGEVYDIPSDKTLLEVLRENGFVIETACELGVCGTCRTRVLEGEVDHKDFVLEADEQEHEMTVCCSRAKSSLLVLDL